MVETGEWRGETGHGDNIDISTNNRRKMRDKQLFNNLLNCNIYLRPIIVHNHGINAERTFNIKNDIRTVI